MLTVRTGCENQKINQLKGHRPCKLTPGGGAPAGSATPGGELLPCPPSAAVPPCWGAATPGGGADTAPPANRFLSGMLGMPAPPPPPPPPPPLLLLVLELELEGGADRSWSAGAASAFLFFFCAAECARKASCNQATHATDMLTVVAAIPYHTISAEQQASQSVI